MKGSGWHVGMADKRELEEQQIAAFCKDKLQEITRQLAAHGEYLGKPNPKAILATLIGTMNGVSKESERWKAKIKTAEIAAFLDEFALRLASLAKAFGMWGVIPTMEVASAQYFKLFTALDRFAAERGFAMLRRELKAASTDARARLARAARP